MKAVRSLFVTLLLLLLCAPTALAADGRFVDYRVDGQTFEGYLISPAPGAPLVLLVHDWDGLTDYEVKRAGMLAELGYAVFAIDMFGKGIRPSATKEKKRLTGALYRDRARMRRLLEGAIDAARSQGLNLGNAVVMGYCFGGAVVLELARSGADFKGFVSFHGGLAIPEGQDYSRTRGSVLVFHGSADKVVSMAQFAAMAEDLEKHGIRHEMTTYGGAPHAFSVFGSNRYREDADRKSWRRFVAYLQETLNP
ncbi:MAG: dienelactone hydrolase family protein [Deltaproteobacteria bacterium]|nr:MAG: dienelactone hydrolase family protein [Deltaproteobacteria bacterium]